MDSFKYDKTSSFEANFQTWYTMNTKERMMHNEEVYELKEARVVFENYLRTTFPRLIFKIG